MALIICPECQQPVSDRAASCPKCGFPFRPPPAPGERRSGLWWGLVLAVPAVLSVVAVVGLLAAIAIPSFLRTRNEAWVHVCLENLREIDAAKEQAAQSRILADGALPSAADVAPYFRGGLAVHTCPRGGRYVLRRVGEEAACTLHGSPSSAHTNAMRPNRGEPDDDA